MHLPARIPANKVACRKTGREAHALPGKAVRAFDLLVFSMKKTAVPVQMGHIALACACLCVIGAANAQPLPSLWQEVQADNPEMVITGNRQLQQNLKTVGLVTVITRQQIEESGASTVNESIMKLGGVIGTPSLYGGNEYSLDLGGYGDTAQSNTVVMLDGVPLREADQSETRLSAIPIEQVERIEIYRGSGNVLYGEGASAGVIHIITRATAGRAAKEATGSAAVSAGSWGTQEIRTNVSKGFESLEINASVADARSDGYRDHARHESTGGQLGLKGWTEMWRWGLNVSAEDIKARTPGALTLAQFQANPRQAQPDSLANDTHMSLKTERYAAFAETVIEGITLRADLAHKNRHYDAVAVQYGSPVPLTFDTQSDYLGLSARKKLQFEQADSTLLVGLEANEWDQSRVYPTYPAWGTVLLDSSSRGLYVKNETDFKATGTRLSLGWRQESFKKNQLFTGFKTSLDEKLHAWDIGLSQSLGSQQAIYARYAKSYRLPNLDEFTSPVYDLSGPVNLVPQTDRTSEVGWKFSDGSRNSIGARLYRTKLNNEIIYDPSQYGNINLESTRRQGVDVYATYVPVQKLLLMASVGWRESTFEYGPNSGKFIPIAAKEVASVRADWTPVANHRIGLGWMYVGRQFIAGDFSNSQSMPSYSLLDLRYSHRVASWEFSAMVRNLMDKKYYSYATTTAGYSVYPDPGRSLLLTARYRF